MRKYLVLAAQILLLTACATVDRSDKDLSAIVERSITLNWGIKQNNPGHLHYQHDGIPGNLASIPGTLTPQEETLAAIILGEPIPPGDEIAIHILGVHEQVNHTGLISTIIATRQPDLNLETLEKEYSGALGVIEAGLVKLGGTGSRSLGFRSERQALETIQRSRESYLSDG